MLHDLYPPEEMAENEEIIATRLGSRITMIKAVQMKAGLCIQSSSSLPCIPSFPRDGAAEGLLGTHPCTQLLLGPLFLLGFISPPHPFLSVNCAAKRHFGKGLWCDRAGEEILETARLLWDQGFPNSSFSQRKALEGQGDEEWCGGCCQFLGISCQEPSQPSASQFSSCWKLFFHVQSVSWASHSPGRKNISFHWIDFLLFSGSDFIPETWGGRQAVLGSWEHLCTCTKSVPPSLSPRAD